MRPKTIAIPAQLWRSKQISEAAKLLWCALRAAQSQQQFTFKELRERCRLCQNSLLRCLRELEANGWLQVERTGARDLRCNAVWIKETSQDTAPVSSTLHLSTELLFDRSLPRPAKWVWGAIRHFGDAFDYPQLVEATGYCHDSLARYLRALEQGRWLDGQAAWVNRRARFNHRAVNPFEMKRQADLKQLKMGLRQAKKQKGYSGGQYLLARMVQLAVPGCEILERVEVTGLDNITTGGRMHYDLFLSAYRLAIEFHGPQHDGPTERFPSQEEYLAQRQRDLAKYGITWEKGVRLVVLRAQDLSFARLREVLEPFLPFRTDFGDQWHIGEWLERQAALYRQSARQA